MQTVSASFFIRITTFILTFFIGIIAPNDVGMLENALLIVLNTI